MSEMRISGLYVYPVKSLGGMKVERFTLDRFGPVADRRWMVVDASGKFFTQRQKSSMSRIHAGLVQRGGEQVLTLSATDGRGFELPVDLSRTRGERIPVKVWSDTCDAIEESAELSAWMSDLLEVNCRVVFMPHTTERLVDRAYAKGREVVGFADGFPLLVTTEPSLSEFCRRLGREIDMIRFRPNLVVDGCAPFAEDNWSRLKVGHIDIDIVKPCARCVMPSINPETSLVEREITETLKQFRRKGEEWFFGQNAIHRGEEALAVGDSVIVEM